MSSTKADIAVAPATPDQRPQATELARRLGLPVCESTDLSFAILLVQLDERLELRQSGPGSPGPVYVDFLTGKADHRRRYGSTKDEGMIKAITSKRNRTPIVLDATGGLGRDAFVLVTHGCRVTICEKNPIIAALLEDGIRRAAADPGIGRMISERFKLIKENSLEVMKAFTEAEKPEVIYLDPMYPHKEKGAQVKKESQALRLLAGKDLDSSILLSQALKTASQRVVVKRPAHAPPLSGKEPDLVVKTKSNRFDVYLT
jgi:16S rRNA (guanine1516-N2)-methyltransferase